MFIDNIAIKEGPTVFYDTDFRAVLEDHMTYLRGHESTTTMAVGPNEAYRWTADLFGLLNSRGVAAYLHWVVMRMNSFNSPTEMDETVSSLIIPDPRALNLIRNIYVTRAKLKT
jgi:hypothetical protein